MSSWGPCAVEDQSEDLTQAAEEAMALGMLDESGLDLMDYGLDADAEAAAVMGLSKSVSGPAGFCPSTVVARTIMLLLWHFACVKVHLASAYSDRWGEKVSCHSARWMSKCKRLQMFHKGFRCEEWKASLLFFCL